jgi:hypothetical protein
LDKWAPVTANTGFIIFIITMTFWRFRELAFDGYASSTSSSWSGNLFGGAWRYIDQVHPGFGTEFFVGALSLSWRLFFFYLPCIPGTESTSWTT